MGAEGEHEYHHPDRASTSTYAGYAELVFISDVYVPDGDLEVVDDLGHQRRNEPL